MSDVTVLSITNDSSEGNFVSKYSHHNEVSDSVRFECQGNQVMKVAHGHVVGLCRINDSIKLF